MVYGRYNELVNGVYKPTYITGGHHPVCSIWMKIWVCLKIVYPNQPNGFADHYPVFKWLFHWEYTLFSDKPIS